MSIVRTALPYGYLGRFYTGFQYISLIFSIRLFRLFSQSTERAVTQPPVRRISTPGGGAAGILVGYMHA
jgi:hypothetical protein